MGTIVVDSSCLIDLRNGSLLEAFLSLPAQVLLPNTILEDDLLGFTAAHKEAIRGSSVKLIDLPGEGVLRAQEILRDEPRLSLHDAFAFALAERHPGCILVTDNDDLRDLGVRQGINVQGVLWVVEEIRNNAECKKTSERSVAT